MSDKKSGQDFMRNWQALQNQYWNAWSDATQSAVGSSAEASMPWQAGIDKWRQMFGNAGEQSEATERLLGSARSYVALMQSLLQFASGKNAGSAPLQSWMDSMRQGFDPGAGGDALNANPMAAMLRGIDGSDMLNPERLRAQFAPLMAQARQEGMSWLQAPAFGFAREHQERFQKALVAFADYQEALKKYNDLMLQVSKRSFEILEGKLAECSEPGRQIDSMRGLYNLWVDAAEDAYAEVALSDEFSKVYGNLVNAQMRVRANLQAEAERLSAEMGMPTRTELDSVLRQLHELRRQSRQRNAGNPEAVADKPVASAKPVRSEPRRPVKTAKAPTKRKSAATKRAPAKAKRSAATTGKFAEAIDNMRSKKGAKSGRARAAAKRASAAAPRKRAAARKSKRGGSR